MGNVNEHIAREILARSLVLTWDEVCSLMENYSWNLRLAEHFPQSALLERKEAMLESWSRCAIVAGDISDVAALPHYLKAGFLSRKPALVAIAEISGGTDLGLASMLLPALRDGWVRDLGDEPDAPCTYVPLVSARIAEISNECPVAYGLAKCSRFERDINKRFPARVVFSDVTKLHGAPRVFAYEGAVVGELMSDRLDSPVRLFTNLFYDNYVIPWMGGLEALGAGLVDAGKLHELDDRAARFAFTPRADKPISIEYANSDIDEIASGVDADERVRIDSFYKPYQDLRDGLSALWNPYLAKKCGNLIMDHMDTYGAPPTELVRKFIDENDPELAVKIRCFLQGVSVLDVIASGKEASGMLENVTVPAGFFLAREAEPTERN